MKTQYIDMRNTQKYNIEWFYNYWKDKGKTELTLGKFRQIFNTADLDEILSYLDKQFNLTVLLSAPDITINGFGNRVDRGSKFIRAYE